VAWYMWFREAEDTGPRALGVSRGVRVVLVVAAIGVLLLGVFPGALLEMAERSALALTSGPLAGGGAAP